MLEKISTRQRLVRETIAQLREQIARLGEQLAAAERTLERLEITHATVLELAAEDEHPPPEAEPLPSGYREILALFEHTDSGLRPKDVCQALGLGTEPKHIEGTRAKLKRLVTRSILTEPEPGLFVLPPPSPTDLRLTNHRNTFSCAYPAAGPSPRPSFTDVSRSRRFNLRRACTSTRARSISSSIR
ncbi:hypothetical protein [Kitasatospora sp. NPDC059803]|uniref:hypothetical protein n=1 Tax=Kitasatospora sp. NPDC059803 TaxID=3346953 RepID=UPI003665B27F